MRDRVCLVTGATSEIGRVAEGLEGQQARVVLVARTEESGERAAAELRAATGNERIEAVQADYLRLDSVRDAARELCRRHPRLDVLVNSAGAVKAIFTWSPTGIGNPGRLVVVGELEVRLGRAGKGPGGGLSGVLRGEEGRVA